MTDANGHHRAEPPDPLQMALNCAAAVERHAEHSIQDPLGSYAARGGDRAYASAQLGACLALISLAADFRHLAHVLTEHGLPARDD
jgi:hypothetical protein